MIWCKMFLVIFGITVWGLDTTSSTQFLLDAPKALFDFVSLASASASQSSSPLSRIVDYRSKEAKASELDKQKENLEQDDLLLERQESKGPEENSSGGNDFMNEASPSFLQKKINKIIAKLRILAQLKNAFSYTPQQYPTENPSIETATTQSNVTITFEDPNPSSKSDGEDVNFNNVTNTSGSEDINFNGTSVEVGLKNDGTQDNSTDIKENSVEELKYAPKKESENVHHIYSIARRAKIVSHQGPEKFNLEVEKPYPIKRSDRMPKHGHKNPIQSLLNNHNGGINKHDSESVESTIQGTVIGPQTSETRIHTIQDSIQNKPNNVGVTQQQEQPSRFGSVGIFFAELLATMVGLAYGAVAQLTSSTNSTPVSL